MARSFQVCGSAPSLCHSDLVSHSNPLPQSSRFFFISGMPLLDLLRELHVSTQTSFSPSSNPFSLHPPTRSFSTAEDWMSMSTASGLGGYPANFGDEGGFYGMGVGMGTGIGRDAGQGQGQGQRVGGKMVEGSDDLWRRVLEIAPQALMDK